MPPTTMYIHVVCDHNCSVVITDLGLKPLLASFNMISRNEVVVVVTSSEFFRLLCFISLSLVSSGSWSAVHVLCTTVQQCADITCTRSCLALPCLND